jgi:8-oxo-dGTP pyrophosphatase MutT (NUDIX family)
MTGNVERLFMLNKIKSVFEERQAGIIGKYRRNAVMILLTEENDEVKLVFEVRAKHLRHQPGDICLPGGKLEPGETPGEGALRETMEELGLEADDIILLGEMDYFVSPYGSIMYPYVAELRKDNISPNLEEVDHVFKVPLRYFFENDPLVYKMEIGPHLKEDFPYELVKGGKDYRFSRGFLNQYFYRYNSYVIWGFTALIVKNFIDIIKRKL